MCIRDRIDRHPFPGPGLAIRILCQREPYMEKDFAETQVLTRLVVNFHEMVEKVGGELRILVKTHAHYLLTLVVVKLKIRVLP